MAPAPDSDLGHQISISAQAEIGGTSRIRTPPATDVFISNDKSACIFNELKMLWSASRSNGCSLRYPCSNDFLGSALAGNDGLINLDQQSEEYRMQEVGRPLLYVSHDDLN